MKICELYRKLCVKFYSLKSKIFWSSPWGVALAHTVYHEYKKTFMYTERTRVFGRLQAVKMFSFTDFKVIEFSCRKNKSLMMNLFFHPFSIIEELGGEDSAIKSTIFN